MRKRIAAGRVLIAYVLAQVSGLWCTLNMTGLSISCIEFIELLGRGRQKENSDRRRPFGHPTADGLLSRTNRL